MQHNVNRFPMLAYKIYDSTKIAMNFFIRRYPINHKSVGLSCDPFFIIGSGRSGNTLLRAILSNHPDISIPPESYALPSIVRKYQSLNYLNWKDLVQLIVVELESNSGFDSWEIKIAPVYQILMSIDKMERSLAKIIDEIYCYYSRQKCPSFKLWGDKTPLNTLYLGWIDKIFDRSRYIHIIRDGRDAVSSYLNAGFYDNIEKACWRWNKSIELSQAFGQSKASHLYIELRYEDLVLDPSGEIKKICKFLNIEYKEDMLDYHEEVEKLGDTKMAHHKNLRRPVNPDSIGKWKKNLSLYDKQIAEKLLRKNLLKLGYS